ncbi:MAG: cell division protein FtsZ [Bacteroidaceae bacterium]|nr:cell division protein FtsZ [Bacteroidaceae bacterium]
MEKKHDFLDTGIRFLDVPVDTSVDIIKVIGVGGGGCNAVRNMYLEGIKNVTFAVMNTDSQQLSKSPVPVKLQLGTDGLGAGGRPERGLLEAQNTAEQIRSLLSDGTKMVFVTASMGGGTGTGAAPFVAKIAKEMGLLTIGIVTIPFSFEGRRKIIQALRGVEQMRNNVDALLIINNESLSRGDNPDERVPMKDEYKRADNILKDAAKSISELITIHSDGDINLDFCDVDTTMRNGGGAIMAMGMASGEHRVEHAIMNALDSPLLYGNDIDRAKRILFAIYASDEAPLYNYEMTEVKDFMDKLDIDIELIWGTSTDSTLAEEVKVIILATGIEDELHGKQNGVSDREKDNDYYLELMARLYTPRQIIKNGVGENAADSAKGEAGKPAGSSSTVESTNESAADRSSKVESTNESAADSSTSAESTNECVVDDSSTEEVNETAVDGSSSTEDVNEEKPDASTDSEDSHSDTDNSYVATKVDSFRVGLEKLWNALIRMLEP